MHDPFKDFDEVYFALCKSVNTPFSLTCWLAWKYRCFTSISKPVPERYDNAHSFGSDYLVYSWASKAQINLENRDLKKVALEGFVADEEHNDASSRRIRSWALRGGSPRVEQVIHDVQRKIASILGPLDIRRVLRSCRFGNGATVSLSRDRARYDKKITTLPFSVSPAALGYGRLMIESDLHWLSAIFRQPIEGPVSLLPCCFEVVDHNAFDTVPKSLKTDRTIAKEPVLNGFLQQGVHVFLRERLKLAGVDLRDQSRNQWLASKAQEEKLATLDAEAASNSVTTALVELLLPPDWFDFLNLLRSRRTRLPDGTIWKNSMFSSMGNAFTFELESLIFFSILHVICKGSRWVSVYGDDMIVPQSFAADCIEMLETFGFRINRGKSFISGRFFESCGKHFFDSFDVTPVYQKSPPRLNRAESIRAHNRLIRWALRSGLEVGLDPQVRGVCSLLQRGVPPSFCGPIGTEEDSYLLVPYGQYVVRHGFAHVDLWSPVSKRHRTRQAGSYAYWHRLNADTLKSPEGLERRGVSPENFAFVCRLGSWRGVTDPSTIESPLELSTASEIQMYARRKGKVPLSSTRVDVSWLT